MLTCSPRPGNKCLEASLTIGRIYSQFEHYDAAALFEARFLAVERLADLVTEHAKEIGGS